MDNEYPSLSRLNRFEKKRKNTKWLSIFIIIGSILIVTFISILIFSNPDSEQAGTDDPNQETPNTGEDDPNQGDDDPDVTNGSNGDDPEENPGGNGEPEPEPNPNDNGRAPVENEREYLRSDDDNVDYAFTSNWAPIPTAQSEPHEITWDQTSLDWQEMMLAAELATGVPVDEMYYLWVSGNGPQSVIATFSNSNVDEHFRVYINWIENEGWQPARVDMLLTHDQMHRFN